MSQLTPIDPSIDVTVCIVNWNGAQWLLDCLQSLRRVQGVRQEVIVVDNASPDDSVKIVRDNFPEVRLVVNSENAGYAKGNNQAIRLGKGRFFFILNNDTVLQDGCLESLIRFLDDHAKAGMVAGHLVNADGSTQFVYYPVSLPSLASLSADLLWLNRLWPRSRLGRGALARHWDPAKPYRMEQIPGACMLVRRELFENAGLFDEAYTFWYEDVDLCARQIGVGWELWYLPEARILHHGGASTKLLDFSSRSLLRFRNMLRYTRSYFSPARLTALRIILALVLLLRFPLVVGASAWPSEKTRRVWKGAWKAYLKFLGELIILPTDNTRPTRPGS